MHDGPIANTPEPPYTAVIFTSIRTEGDAGYADMALRMEALASKQPGFLGVESAREGVGITVSYWCTDVDALAWKRVVEHCEAQRLGRTIWYDRYMVRVATVERDYGGGCGAATDGRMTSGDGFVQALLEAPLGVALLGVLEGGYETFDDFRTWTHASPTSTAAGVAAAVAAVETMTLGELLDAALYAGLHVAGPWMPGAPAAVANAYRNAGARAPIAVAIDRRFGAQLHAPLNPGVQQWWSCDLRGSEPMKPILTTPHRADNPGLWTVSDPPAETHNELVAAWELEVGPVTRCHLPVSGAARVYEIHRPDDWVRLVSAHPIAAHPSSYWELPNVNRHVADVEPLLATADQRAARATTGRLLEPDWRSVAHEYDGVHLSWAGFITSEGCITDMTDGDVIMLRLWMSESTRWLNDVFGDPRPELPPKLADWWDQRSTLGEKDPSASAAIALRQLLGR